MWEPKGNLPPFLYEAAEAVRTLVYYQRWQFSELGAEKRSERLEAIVLVLLTLIYRTDLVSRRIGSPPTADGEWFRGITAEYIHRWTGLRLGRVRRALDDLRWAGYIKSVQPCELDEETGEYRGLAAVRSVTMKLWTRLRIKDKFDTAVMAACRLRLNARRVNEQRSRKVRRSRTKAAAKISALSEKATPTREQSEEYMKRLHMVKAQLYQANPDWTFERLRAEALKLV
jgi:hypothetical protein